MSYLPQTYVILLNSYSHFVIQCHFIDKETEALWGSLPVGAIDHPRSVCHPSLLPTPPVLSLKGGPAMPDLQLWYLT